MGLVRVLLIVALVGILWYLWRSNRARAARTTRLPAARPTARCAQCGLHLPASEALSEQGRSFCCDAHRLAYKAAHGPENED